MAVGLDVGTAYLASSRNQGDKVVTQLFRDAFLTLDGTKKETRAVLERMTIPYLEYGKEFLVLGDHAIEFANVFKLEARRPMRMGVLSPRDPLARDVLARIIQSLVGDPESPREVCCYSVPAMPLGVSPDDFDITYHKMTLDDILTGMGYKPIAVNEAQCIIFDSLKDQKYSGVAFSFGAGLVNVCLAIMGLIEIGGTMAAFGTLKSGDWIDRMVANLKMGMTSTKVAKIKEDQSKPIDIQKDNGSSDVIRDGISKYYQAMIEETLENVSRRFGVLDLGGGGSMPLVVAGGTSMIKGFIPVFQDVLKKVQMPFQVTEVIHSKNPLTSVSRGALIRAALES